MKNICYSQPELVHKIPDNVPDSVAVLTEPMAVAMNGVIDRTKVELGDVVVISGAGPIGQLSAVCLRGRRLSGHHVGHRRG